MTKPKSGLVGERNRVVNGKRTTLTDLLLKKAQKVLQPQAIKAPQVFQGHTRFATTSIAALPGCHPHQWCKPSKQIVWVTDEDGKWVGVSKNVESYITHNGDLDFLNLHGTVYALGDIQTILCAMLHTELPATVDSMGVAGLLDLLRTKGMWSASVRYGYLFGALTSVGGELPTMAQRGELWDGATLAKATEIFEAAFKLVVTANGASTSSEKLRTEMTTELSSAEMERTLKQLTFPPGLEATACRVALVTSVIDAFFDQGLLQAARQLLGSAMGSFGLVLSHSLDADKELVVAARGQTMSIAFYPETGLVLFGSESAATKAGMTLQRNQTQQVSPSDANGENAPGSIRLDLDDVNGEVVQLRWGRTAQMRKMVNAETGTAEVMKYRGSQNEPCSLIAWYNIEGTRRMQQPLMKRMLQLAGNPLVQELPAMGMADPVGNDIEDIPGVLKQIKDDWNEPEESLNRMTAFTLSNQLRKRMRARTEGGHDGSLDVLITGCEVSLWLGEQFASDLHLAFPQLSIECLSANKLLGMLGQGFPMPQSGFRFNSRSHNLRNTIVLLVSHSGGTFATLNCSYLLKAFTRSLFVVTSVRDSQTELGSVDLLLLMSADVLRSISRGSRNGILRWRAPCARVSRAKSRPFVWRATYSPRSVARVRPRHARSPSRRRISYSPRSSSTSCTR